MRALVQRVLQAAVVAADRTVGEISHGLLVLVAVHRDDGDADVRWLCDKLAGLRIFRGADKHFDQDVKQVGGAILVVSNFTVLGETRKGRRPSFDAAASPERGRELYEKLVDQLKATGVPVATGEFGADMRVSLVNDGPATFIVDSRSNHSSMLQQ